MKTGLFTVRLVLAVLTLSQVTQAKGIPDLVVIKGGGLTSQIDITDQQTLKIFSPWNGEFIDWKKGSIAPPTQDVREFEILFFMRSRERHSPWDRSNLKLIYGVKYCQRVDGSPGYVYLPGEGEQYHSLNIGTILRENDHGKWHQAAEVWEKVVQRLLLAHKSGDRAAS